VFSNQFDSSPDEQLSLFSSRSPEVDPRALQPQCSRSYDLIMMIKDTMQSLQVNVVSLLRLHEKHLDL